MSEQRDHGVELIGPARHDQRWQAWAGKGFAAEHFDGDWKAKTVTCPAGKQRLSCPGAKDRRGRPVVKITFAIGDGRTCPSKTECTTAPRRTVTLQARDHHEALVEWRAWAPTDEFKTLYAQRAGTLGNAICRRSLSRNAALELLRF